MVSKRNHLVFIKFEWLPKLSLVIPGPFIFHLHCKLKRSDKMKQSKCITISAKIIVSNVQMITFTVQVFTIKMVIITDFW